METMENEYFRLFEFHIIFFLVSDDQASALFLKNS